MVEIIYLLCVRSEVRQSFAVLDKLLYPKKTHQIFFFKKCGYFYTSWLAFRCKSSAWAATGRPTQTTRRCSGEKINFQIFLNYIRGENGVVFHFSKPASTAAPWVPLYNPQWRWSPGSGWRWKPKNKKNIINSNVIWEFAWFAFMKELMIQKQFQKIKYLRYISQRLALETKTLFRNK